VNNDSASSPADALAARFQSAAVREGVDAGGNATALVHFLEDFFIRSYFFIHSLLLSM
jgi:hypothetical protein